MPRTRSNKSVSDLKVPQSECLPSSEKQEVLSDKDKCPANGRDHNGRFAKGNAGGRGNPFARRTVQLLEVFHRAVSEEELFTLTRKLLELALAGDVAAIKIVLAYKIGKPREAPNPDELDLEEWRHYQKNSVKNDEATLVLGSLPASSLNGLVAAALPIMTQERLKKLASQLSLDSASRAKNQTQPGKQKAGREKPRTSGPKHGVPAGWYRPLPISKVDCLASDLLGSPSALDGTALNGQDIRACEIGSGPAGQNGGPAGHR